MEETTEQTAAMEMPASKERPAFLTALCVLTFIAVPLYVVLNVEAFIVEKASVDSMQSMYDAAKSMQDMGGMGDMANSYMDEAMHGIYMMYITFLSQAACALLCLGGALMMWRMKKAGFFLYAAGEIVPVIIAFFTMSTGTFADVSLYVMPVLGVHALTMTVLYGLNLKHFS